MHLNENRSLEQILYESLKDEYIERNKNYQVGDVVLTSYYSTATQSTVSAHRVIVITRLVDEDKGVTRYEGLPLKSIHPDNDKSNKAGGYPNSIYIKNYSSILTKGDSVPYPSKSVFLDVSDSAKFTSYQVSPQRSSYAGHVTDEFYDFAIDTWKRYKSGKDNSEIYWER